MRPCLRAVSKSGVVRAAHIATMIARRRVCVANLETALRNLRDRPTVPPASQTADVVDVARSANRRLETVRGIVPGPRTVRATIFRLAANARLGSSGAGRA